MTTPLAGLGIDLFDYSDAIAFMNDYYHARKIVQPTWSLSAWAKRLGLKSHSLLSLLLNRRRRITPPVLAVLLDYYALTPVARAYFETLVLLEDTNVAARAALEARLAELRVKRDEGNVVVIRRGHVLGLQGLANTHAAAALMQALPTLRPFTAAGHAFMEIVFARYDETSLGAFNEMYVDMLVEERGGDLYGRLGKLFLGGVCNVGAVTSYYNERYGLNHVTGDVTVANDQGECPYLRLSCSRRIESTPQPLRANVAGYPSVTSRGNCFNLDLTAAVQKQPFATPDSLESAAASELGTLLQRLEFRPTEWLQLTDVDCTVTSYQR